MKDPADSSKNTFSDSSLWEETFLRWFAATGAPLSERRLGLGGFEYFQFSSAFQTKSGRTCGAFGRSQDRRIAAIKCAAEYVERQTMMEFFQNSTDDSTDERLFPECFHTSNGWAVYSNPEEAQRRSYQEALERHLLLKSFLQHGWAGFKLVDKIQTPEMELYFLSSCYEAGDLVSGIVAAKSILYPGVSFGYCIGSKGDLLKTHFWESAVFESIDKILTLKGKEIDLTEDPSSWLRQETKVYLETPFDLELFQAGKSTPSLCEERPTAFTETINLTSRLGLSFPLYAAFSWGRSLIPLFHKASMKDAEILFLQEILKANGIQNRLPERHPIL